MKVWVVTDRYSVRGVFSSLKKANEYIREDEAAWPPNKEGYVPDYPLEVVEEEVQ